MKNILLAGILTATGMIAMASQANAAHRYCIFNPDDPVCQDFQDYQDNPDYQDSGDYDPPPRRAHGGQYNQFYGNNYPQSYYDDGPIITLQFGSRYKCNDLANSLRQSGFRRVRPVDCAGRDFAFLAFRDGRSLKIGMSSRTGRINSIKPY